MINEVANNDKEELTKIARKHKIRYDQTKDKMEDDDVADDSHAPELNVIQGWRFGNGGKSRLLTDHRHPDSVNWLAVNHKRKVGR